MALAPPRVAQSTTCSARRWWLVTALPSLWFSKWSMTRSADSVARMAEKMSALHHTLVSWDSETGMPYLRSFQVGGYPWPALHSLSVETDTEPPVAAIMWYESGDSDAECT